MDSSYLPEGVTIEPARESDVPRILSFIRELAEYEKLAHEVEATEDGLRRTLFGERAHAETVIARYEGQPAGFALFFHNYSTFLARPGIYLEDLFVRPDYRGKGIGKTLLVHLARLAMERSCGRIEWWVLDRNTSAIEFYESLGAQPMNEWTVFRLNSAGLRSLAG